MDEILILSVIAIVLALILIIAIFSLIKNLVKTHKRKKRKRAFKEAEVEEMNACFIERYRLGKRLYFVYENDDGRIVVIVKPEQYGLNDTRDGTLYYKVFEGKNYFVKYRLLRKRYKVDKEMSDEIKSLLKEIVNNPDVNH